MRTLVKTVVTVVVMGLTLVSCDSKSIAEEEALYRNSTEGNTEEVKKKPNS